MFTWTWHAAVRLQHGRACGVPFWFVDVGMCVDWGDAVCLLLGRQQGTNSNTTSCCGGPRSGKVADSGWLCACGHVCYEVTEAGVLRRLLFTFRQAG
jgi:hypothetical protein